MKTNFLDWKGIFHSINGRKNEYPYPKKYFYKWILKGKHPYNYEENDMYRLFIEKVEMANKHEIIFNFSDDLISLLKLEK